MKKLTLLVLFLFSTLSFSQKKESSKSEIDTTIVTTTESLQNVEKLVDKYSGKVYELVKELATNLKVPIEKLIIIIAKQALVESIVNIFLGLFGLLTLYLLLNFFKKVKSWNPNIIGTNDENLNGEFIIKLILSIIGFICILVFIFDIQNTITGIVNPEFRIIEILSNSLK